MIFRTLVAAAILTSAAYAADFDRTLTVSPSADLYVSTNSGRIHIVPGSDSQIHIRAHVYAGWNAGGDIDSRINRISQEPPIRQSGNEVHVGDVSPEDRHLFNNITIDYEISAPRSVALNLRSGSGDIEVDNLGRFLKAQTGSGSVRAHGVGGPAELQTGSGDVDLEENAPGEVKAQTGSGSIRIHGLEGALTARTGSGDIQADGSITGESRLQSGSGSVRVHLGQSSHLNVEASTGSGSIRIAGASSSEHHHLDAPFHGGGPTLEVHTGSGDIDVN
jgi:DUF4097 and DUF4098 domain-containing protein YvlB